MEGSQIEVESSTAALMAKAEVPTAGAIAEALTVAETVAAAAKFLTAQATTTSR
jgi:hypothetical protein